VFVLIPESEYIRKEFTVRQMDLPDSVKLTKKSLLRWCCLSLGLLSPNESRDKALLVYDSLFIFLFKKKQAPTTLDLQSLIKEKSSVEMSEKLIRYHLNRLIVLGILVREKTKYKINPSPDSEKRNSISESFKDWVKKPVEQELNKVSISLEKLQEIYEK
jgi:hypothetical protein